MSFSLWNWQHQEACVLLWLLTACRAVSGPFLVKLNAAVSFIFLLLILYRLCLEWKIEYLLLVWDSECSWACWTGWICFSLLDLFRSSPLLKPKELKCPAGACAPLPCPAFYILFFFKQWGLFVDKHLLEHSVLAFQIASAGERLTASSEDCWVFYLRTQRQASSGMSVCDWSLQRYCPTDTPAAVCCLLKPLADMQTWCQSPDHWRISLGLFVHQTIIPWFLLLLFLVDWCFYFCDAEDWTRASTRIGETLPLGYTPNPQLFKTFFFFEKMIIRP